ncbi:MAG: hypothetical protein HYR51_02745 [Candidatus Rokubacteria bacterium]|nr:hypothetical protein [Candidatus Rokubacteria bacterium]
MLRALGASILIALAALPARAGDEARAAVERFVARIAGVEIRDLVIEQTITLYHPDGLHPTSRGEQRLLIKPPGRQRLEEVIEGRREVRLVAGGRTWIRRADGKTYEAPSDRDAGQAHLMVPLRRSADELLAAWRALGIRDDVTDSVRVAGRALTVIGAKAGDRESPAVWLDPERGVVRVIRRERLPKGPALIDLAFSEHRPLRGGFHFPHRQEAFVDGRLVLVIDVRSAAVNVDLPDSLFDPEALRRER